MKEFMFRILNLSNHKESFSPEIHQEFLKKCEVYIAKLKAGGNLIAAQPLVREGKIVSKTSNGWKEIPFNETDEVQVGYYHILAKDLDHAIELAKGNPEFEYGETARIEIRPIKMKESTTGFVYPK